MKEQMSQIDICYDKKIKNNILSKNREYIKNNMN